MAQLGPLISLVVIMVPLLAFWAWMANDMLQNDRLPNLVTNDAKLDWTVAFILANVVAAVAYYALVYRNQR